jgi:glycosyltransferase involved in cell wall biosynthesis
VPRLSVVICSHNPRPAYLHRVLEALKAQTLFRRDWELVLIDNASDRRLADGWDLSWHPNHVHIRENQLGLTYARLRGIRETTGSLLVFLDDDNLLAPDYLERATALARMYPYLGVIGAGVLDPEFEVEPPSELVPSLGQLALRSATDRFWTNNPKDNQCVPCGAGLCVSRPVATAYVQVVGRLNISDQLDRHGERLFCGGDDLFSWVSARIGCGFGVFPDLRLTHLIGKYRLNQPYFLRLAHDHAYSHGILNFLFFGDDLSQPDYEAVVRTVLHGMRRGWFSMRIRWAAALGARRARVFLARQCLHPIGAQSTEPVTLNGLFVLQSAGEPHRLRE